jgi:hypothetical protein
MSDTEDLGQVRRSWQTSEDDSLMRCYLVMRHRVTVRELLAHLAERHPDVDAMTVNLNFGTATWEEPPNDADVAFRAAWRVHQAVRHEAWERDIYARLKAKFETGNEETT